MATRRALVLAVSLAGLPLGLLLLLALRLAGEPRPAEARTSGEQPFDVLHKPPSFVSKGKPVRLTYEIVCPLPAEGPPTPEFLKTFCMPHGTLYVRQRGASKFDEIALTGANHRAVVSVPSEYTAGAGFDYYAQIRDERGVEATLPEGGAEDPQSARVVERWITVVLGRSTFGETRPPDAILAEGSWGSGPGQFGRDASVGASAFDVAPDGSVVVLDQLNRRLLAFDKGRSDRSRAMPIRFTGGEGDLAIDRNGTIYVLESSARPAVHAYTASGQRLSTTRVPGSGSQELSIGPNGAIAYSYPSEMWFPVGKGRPTPGQTFPGGGEVLVHAADGEARYQLVGTHPGGWRLRSATNLGEVQLARPYRDGLAVVTRFWTEKKSEFVFLELTQAGVAQRFTIDTAETVEAGVSSRFRLHGTTLYQLRSLRSRLEIAAYRLR